MKKIDPSKIKSPLLIEDIDQLQAIVNEAVYCEFKLNGQPIRLKCTRVMQGVDEQVRALRRAATPPWNPKLGRDGDYDYMNQGFLAQKDLNAARARSLIIYSCCPAVAAKKPALVKVEEIHEFVKSILTENIAEVIALTATAGGMELVERVNFTSTPASES